MSEIEQNIQDKINIYNKQEMALKDIENRLLEGKTIAWDEITALHLDSSLPLNINCEKDIQQLDVNKLGIDNFTNEFSEPINKEQVKACFDDQIKSLHQTVQKHKMALHAMQQPIIMPIDSLNKDQQAAKELMEDMKASSEQYKAVIDYLQSLNLKNDATYADVENDIIPGSTKTIKEFLDTDINHNTEFLRNDRGDNIHQIDNGKESITDMIYDLSGQYQVTLRGYETATMDYNNAVEYGLENMKNRANDNLFPGNDNKEQVQEEKAPENPKAKQIVIGDLDSAEARKQKKIDAQNKLRQAHLDRAEQSKIVKFCDQQIQLVQDAIKDMPEGEGKDKTLAQLATVEKNKQKALKNIQLDTDKIKTQKEIVQQMSNEAIRENIITPVQQSFQHAHSTLSELGQNISDSGYVAIQSVGSFIANRNAAFQIWRQDHKDQKAINEFLNDNYSCIGEQSRSAYRVADLRQIEFEKESMKQLDKDLTNLKKDISVSREKREIKNHIKLDIKKFFARGDKFEELKNQPVEHAEFTAKELNAVRAIESSISQSRQRIVDKLDAYIESAQMSLDKSKELENSFGGRKTEKIMGFKDSRDRANKDLQHDINQAKDEIQKEMDRDPKVQSRTTERTR